MSSCATAVEMKEDNMYSSVVDVKPLEGYRLHLTFENREERIFDVSPYLSIGKFSELRDVSLFNTVAVKFDSVEWANQLDFDPEILFDDGILVT
jgi:hypothetical protein